MLDRDHNKIIDILLGILMIFQAILGEDSDSSKFSDRTDEIFFEYHYYRTTKPEYFRLYLCRYGRGMSSAQDTMCFLFASMILFFWGFGVIGYLFAMDDRMVQTPIEVVMPHSSMPYELPTLQQQVNSALL